MEHLQSGLGTTLFSSFSWVRGQICFMMLLSSAFSFAVFDFTEVLKNVLVVKQA